jgi:dienelactone hydrolase
VPEVPGPHLDSLAGLFAGVVHRLARETEDTRADAEAAYAGRPRDVLFPAPAALPVARVRRRWLVPGLGSEDIVFRSLHDPLEPGFRARYERDYAEVQTVYARRVRPAGSERRPRLLYLHGYMQPETFVEELAVLATFATRLGVEVVQLQTPYHGRRRPRCARFDGELYCSADVVRSVEAIRQSLLDARTLLSWLLAQDERPVGVTGLSLGGALTAALTCLEPRLAFSIPLIAHMDLGALLADAPVLGRMRRELAAFGWSPRDFGAFMARLGWDDLVPVIPRERIFLVAASDDRFFEADVVRAMWRRWGEPRIEWHPTSHMGFLRRLPGVLSRMRGFIDEQPGRPARAAHRDAAPS